MTQTPETSAALGGEPHAIYREAIDQQKVDVTEWRKKSQRLSNLRLAIFLFSLVLAWLAFGSQQLSAIWLVPSVVAFVMLLIWHDRVIRQREKAERTLNFFERGLARLEERWMGQGEGGLTYKPKSHPYAEDLDLFGEGSLFELLNTARTEAGQQMLARWLLEPCSAEMARQRQASVQELTPQLNLRRDLSLLGEEIGPRPIGHSFVQWGQAPERLSKAARVAIRGLAFSTSVLTLAGLAAWIWTAAGAIPFLAAAAFQAASSLAVRHRVRPIVDAVEAPGQELVTLSGMLARMEEESFQSERLADLREQLASTGERPSVRIAQLRRMIDLLEARQNQFFAPFAALLCWTTHLSLSLEKWRIRCGGTLGPWIEGAAEIEVLCALSGYAYENPENVFPEWIDQGPLFEGQAIGHPLLPKNQCVRNDLSLGGQRRVLMMSGSNMSGKSTMLRTVGTASLMAMLGLSIRGEALKLSPMQIAASIRISDSLQQGASHFFAEIQRLRWVVDLTEKDWPVLFLLDEVLHGTNSHDRRIGAEAVIAGLIGRKAIGIVTTHDLALAEIAEPSDGAIENVHFEDQFDGDQMRFDYILRPGVVTRSNALALMRNIGLDV